MMAAAPPGAVGLARLLARFRARSLWTALWRAPARPSLRFAAVLALLAPAAYIALFANAFQVVVAEASRTAAVAVLAVTAWTIALASVAFKAGTGDAVVAGSGENEFLLTRPVALPTLLVARSLAGAVTDLFDALFLFPLLLAAALVWNAGVVGVVAALATSVLAQVAVTAAAQAVQIALVRVVPPRGRRAAWTVLALAGATAMAGVWVLGAAVLRDPIAVASSLARWPLLGRFPASVLAAPVAAADPAEVAAALAVVAAFAAAVVGLSWAGARWAARRGWEGAGSAWAEASRGPRQSRAPLTPFRKEARVLLRDRARLVALLALPAIVVGIQAFGSAGWGWTTAAPRNSALLAFSMAAYLATLGPLRHLQTEGGAFWLVRATPASLHRVFAARAAFWSLLVGATAALVYAGARAAGAPAPAVETVQLGALAVLGAVAVSWLAIGVGSGAVDLADDRRGMGIGTVYLFLAVAGLYNVALASAGAVRVRALLLYAFAVVAHWMLGVARAARAYDPEETRRRGVEAADGALLALLLFLGDRAQRMAFSGEEQALALAVWAGVVGIAALVLLLRAPADPPRLHRLAAWSAALLIGAGAAALLRFAGTGATVPLAAALVRAAADELVFRAIVQRGLERHWSGSTGRVGACAVAATVMLTTAPVAPWGVAIAVTGGVARAVAGGVAPALLARLVLELASR